MLLISEYKGNNGKHYCVAYLKNQFYFVHFTLKKSKELQAYTTKKGRKCWKYEGNFRVEENRIYLID